MQSWKWRPNGKHTFSRCVRECVSVRVLLCRSRCRCSLAHQFLTRAPTQSRKRGSEEIVAQTAKIARVPTAFAITFGNVCDDSDGTDAVVLSLDAG
jgi:hypothetical protein